jgi:hypothetical protein
MNEREDLFYRLARALDHSSEASETQQAADLAHDTPENAAAAHWDAAGLLEGCMVRIKAMHDQHVFAARRMERAADVERRTGIEHRSGNDTAA